MREVFEQFFLLRDHPFTPDHGRDISPDRPLNYFSASKPATDYFARQLAAFSDGITALEDFLAVNAANLVAGKPPAIMILGSSGSGRNTMAAYAAHLAREECLRQGATKPLSYADVSDTSDDPARFLDEFRQVVIDHLTLNGIDCQPAVTAAGAMDANAPNEKQLQRLFRNLAKRTPSDLPLAIIAIGPIYARRESWMADFRELLAPVRVMPIFYTSDSTVAATFDASDAQSPRVVVQTRELEPGDALQLLTHRFSLLQVNRTPTVDPLFPYSSDLIQRLFPGGRAVNIKYILTVCSAAFNAKLAQVRRYDPKATPPRPQPDPRLTFNEIETAVKNAPRGRS